MRVWEMLGFFCLSCVWVEAGGLAWFVCWVFWVFLLVFFCGVSHPILIKAKLCTSKNPASLCLEE